MNQFRPSPEQEEAFSFVESGEGNAVLEAVAGSGKTTTLVQMCRLFNGDSAVFTAFNKKVSVDIERNLKAEGIYDVKAATFHSIGLGTWRRVEWNVEVEADKTRLICEKFNLPKSAGAFIRAAVSVAKQSCFGIECSIKDEEAWLSAVDHFDLEEKLYSDDESGEDPIALDDALEMSMRVFEYSIDINHRLVDFDDMLFAPLYHDAKFYKNNWVLIDEAQDTNRARRLMAERMLDPWNGRLIAVGDRHQAIYGFTGADADALDLIQEKFHCVPLPLTVSWRCAKEIIRQAQIYVPEIQHAPGAPDGCFGGKTEEEFKKLDLQPTDVILCRNTKPLVELALGYIRKGVPCLVEGRDIGQGLIQLTRKWRKARTVSGLRSRLEKYLERQVKRLTEKGRRGRAELMKDKVESLYAVADNLPGDASLDELRHSITQLFGDSEEQYRPRLTLSTIHKAKGREWDRVFIYGRDKYMPSKYAKQDWELQQENNLIYVATTRAKRELTHVNLGSQ